jgi:hypothetical protein
LAAKTIVFNHLNVAVQKHCIKSLGGNKEINENKSQWSNIKMASRRHIFTFAVVGILIAAGLIAVGTLGPTVLLPAIFPAKAGTFDIKITDAPVQDLSSLNITVDQFEVHQQETDQWTNVTITGGQVTFDLVKLRNVTQDAALDQISPGNYTKIRMHVLSAIAQIDGGDVITVRFPPNKLDVIVHFEVKAGQTTSVILDIQVDTFKIAENLQHNATPVIKATVIPPT